MINKITSFVDLKLLVDTFDTASLKTQSTFYESPQNEWENQFMSNDPSLPASNLVSNPICKKN